MNSSLVLLFDMDDTILVEEDSAMNALIAASERLSEFNIDPLQFAVTVKEKAREIWHSLPTIKYCKDIGISSWEGLWARFEGSNSDIKKLKELRDSYQCNSWNNALKDYGINNMSLAGELSDLFNQERRSRHIHYPETIEVLNKLKSEYQMCLITNGLSDLQREKIRGGRLEQYFDLILISGEVNHRKPEKQIFQKAFSHFKKDKKSYIMIGNSLKSDIGGAANAGIKSVWVNRAKENNNNGTKPDYEISNLVQLYDILKDMNLTAAS